MEVLLANPRGFCAGVDKAVGSLTKALAFYGPPIYVFHEIVHNRHVVEDFRRQGAVFVDSIDEVPAGSIVMYSAHGVSPRVKEASLSRSLTTVDATCPLVTKVHLEALSFAQAGYQILLIGHAGHDEVIGTIGHAPHAIRIVENVADIDGLNFDPGTKLAYLTQTTLSIDDAEEIIAALVKKFPHIVGPKKKDICYATQNRQQAIKSLAHKVDLVLIVGSQNSSNSLRLLEIARLAGKEAYLIDHVTEIQAPWLEAKQRVLLSAGASAPEHLVQACVEFLKYGYGATVRNVEGVEENIDFGIARELRNLEV